MTQTVRVKKLRENAVLPSYGSDYAAGRICMRATR